MAAQFQCALPDRRVLLQNAIAGGSALNGIDYVEVLDRAAEAIGSPRQRTLLVHLFQPPKDPLAAANVRLDGGGRDYAVTVEWAYLASGVPVGPATAAEQAFFAALPDAARTLVVRTSARGDYSNYRLTLVGYDWLDRVLATVEFNFKVECDSPFDCRQPSECPPPAARSPVIDYSARDYQSFRQLILDRLAVLMPDWRERNPADVGVVSVELLAYLADRLAYYQDAVATEAYLGTARKRISVRRHARLLDYFMHEGCNARAFVTISVGADGVVVPRVQAGRATALLTRVAAETRVAPDKLDDVVQTLAPTVFEPLHDLVAYVANNRMRFYTWGDNDCCLPKGATQATLFDDPVRRVLLRPGDVIVFEEQKGRDTGKPGDADPARRQAVRLVSVKPEAHADSDDPAAPRTPGPLEVDPLTGQAIVEIAWHPGDALTMPFCLSTSATGLALADVSGAVGNVVLVDQGLTVHPDEPLSPAEVPADGRYRPQLARPEVTHAVPFDEQMARTQPAAAALAEDPHAALPDVTLVGAESWSVQRDLLRSDRFAPDFVVEMQEDGTGVLRFGDGVLGRPPESHLRARYRVGRGRGGNVGADTITHIASGDTDIIGVRNPLPAVGGADPESLDEVRLYAPQAFRVQKRAVTEDDYAAAAQKVPGVQKAVARRLWTGSWFTVFVTVDRLGTFDLDDNFVEEVAAALDRVRMAGEDVEIEPPAFVPLDLRLVVCVAPGYRRDQVELALRDAFSARQLADGSLGFFHPDNFTFGQPVYLSAIIARAMRVPGVAYVDPTHARFRFERLDSGETAGVVASGLLEVGRLEIARLSGSLDAPADGRFDVVTLGGL